MKLLWLKGTTEAFDSQAITFQEVELWLFSHYLTVLCICRNRWWSCRKRGCLYRRYYNHIKIGNNIPTLDTYGFVVLCFVVVMQSFIMNSHELFIHIHQGCFAGTGTIVRLPQCQWSKPDGYGKISQCITTTKHSKAKTVCIFLGICCKQPATLTT